jgi:hypothetical protein
VRVNISLLSEDASTAFYVSRESGSLAQSFSKKSLAWFSLVKGRAIWWKETYQGKSIPLTSDVTLDQQMEGRGDSDYKGFVILPVPWARRPEGEGRRAGIHISFRNHNYMDLIWEGLDGNGQVVAPPYKSWTDLLVYPRGHQPPGKENAVLHIKDRELREVLLRSVSMLSSLFGHFNDDVFEEYVRPQTRPQ